MLSLALCSFCIGFSRQGLDQWMVRYFQEVHSLGATSGVYQLVSAGAPFLGVLGAIVAGTSSDKLWHARRPPVIFLCYVGQLASFLLLARSTSPLMAAVAILGASFCISGSHSLLLGVCTMDFGGRRAVATAAGFFDGLQYLAGALTGRWLGTLLDQHGWGVWAYSLMPTALCGALIMLRLWNLTPETAVIRGPPAQPSVA
jgi:OPA family glycerol-3-phosphate transporter-like MFS transporter